MIDQEIQTLRQNIGDFIDWMNSISNTDSKIRQRYVLVLDSFLNFTRSKKMAHKEGFTLDVATYLNSHESIDHPKGTTKHPIPLPEVYDQYLLYHQQSLQMSDNTRRQIRRLLVRFHEYLERFQIELSSLKIEHLDAFMAEFKIKQTARRIYRSHLRGFLKYLYYEQGIIKKDLAPLLVGPRQFAKQKPPKFLRPEEVQKLFASLGLSTPVEIRTYAIVHLAYFLGLRPVEISRITFDDLLFSKGDLSLPERKGDNPITLPVPENVLKAIAAYVLKARPKSPDRHLFLSFHFPYRPMSPGNVVGYLFRIMKKAGLAASGYWLRHTYAQNLLQMGRSVFEIKEMLGHDNINSTAVYLHINTVHMRKVLFNETL
ncbi:MAG: site-specific integrase [Methanosarcinaceae archaeon]|nr:site-specific integrase [Methanosarcinaceae archaeon]